MATVGIELRHRRVVTGNGPGGRSRLVSDGPAPVTYESDAFNLIETWRIGSVPTALDRTETVQGPPSLEPEPGEVLCRFCHFAPDGEGRDWGGSLESIGGDKADDSTAEQAAVHQTETLDHILIVSGEIYLVLDDGEVLLRAGDVLVQRGTSHSWSNRSREPCVVFTIQVKSLGSADAAAATADEI